MRPLERCACSDSRGVRYLACTVSPAWDGAALGLLLRRGLGLSAGAVQRAKMLEDGLLLDGVRAAVNVRVRPGQQLRVRLSDTGRKSGIVPAPHPLTVLYEDADLLVVSKPAPLAVHPGAGHWADTLGGRVLAYYDRQGAGDDFHPVHRLDKGTSGAMVVARHAYAQEALRLRLHTADFSRAYLAVCDGAPPAEQGCVDLPIGRADGSVIRREVRPDGDRALTEYRVLRRAGARTLVRLQLKTGRTHQIRVHMAALGCPLTGDFLYGTENPALIARPALHAHLLSFRHPLSGRRLTFALPLSADMAALL